MKCLTALPVFLSLLSLALAQLRPYPHQQDQVAMNPQGPGIQIPAQDPPSQQNPKGDVTLFDILGSQKLISLFFGFTRDIDTISGRLNDGKTNTTLLAPVNSAISALPRKPWEDPRDYDKLGANAYDGEGGSERAAKNLQRFVEAHIVPDSPWAEGEKVKTLGGRDLWWESKGDGKVIMPGNIEVQKVAKRVTNGEVWILGGVVNYA